MVREALKTWWDAWRHTATSVRRRRRPDPADMGTAFGLEASLTSGFDDSALAGDARRDPTQPPHKHHWLLPR